MTVVVTAQCECCRKSESGTARGRPVIASFLQAGYSCGNIRHVWERLISAVRKAVATQNAAAEQTKVKAESNTGALDLEAATPS